MAGVAGVAAPDATTSTWNITTTDDENAPIQPGDQFVSAAISTSDLTLPITTVDVSLNGTAKNAVYLNLTVTLTNPGGSPVTVRYKTDGTAPTRTTPTTCTFLGASTCFINVTAEAAPHNLTVLAFDDAGNDEQAMDWITITLDRTAPITTLTTTLNGTATNASHANVTVTLTNPGGSPVAIRYTTNGTVPTGTSGSLCNPGGGATCVVSVTAEGEHNVTVTSFDEAGNDEADVEWVRFTVDRTAPLTTLPTTLNGTANNSASVSIPVTLTNPGGSPVAIRYTTNGTAPTRTSGTVCNPDGGATCAIALSAEGYHNVSVLAFDEAGNDEPVREWINFTLDRTPPGPTTTNFTGNNTPRNATQTVYLNASTGGSPVTLLYTLNGTEPTLGSASVYTGPLVIAAEGTTVVKYRAVDAAGNWEASTQFLNVIIDLTGPMTAFTPLPAWTGASSFPVAWTGLDGTGAGIANYTVRVNASNNNSEWALATNTTAVNLTFTGGLNGTKYTFFVRARDLAGNLQAAPGATVNTTLDLVAPASATTSPVNGTTLNQSVTIPLQVTTSGGSPVAIRYTLNGTAPTRTTGTECNPGGAASCSVTLSADGAYNLTWRAFDAAGNDEPGLHWLTFTLDLTLPVSSTTFPGGASNQTVTIPLAIANPGGSNAFIRYTLDGSTPTRATGTLYSTPITRSDEGTTTLKFRAFDAAGNDEATVHTVTITIDKTPPSQTLMGTLPGWTNTATFTVSWAGEDNPGGSGIGGYAVAYLDSLTGNLTIWIEDTIETSALFEGQDGVVYGFFAAAYDLAGNDEPEPEEVSVAITGVDLTPPESASQFGVGAVLSPEPVLVNLSLTNRQFAPAFIRYTLDGSTPTRTDGTLYTAPFNVSAEGLTRLAWRAFDEAGNDEPVPHALDIRVDTTPPNASIPTAPPALTNATTVPLTWSGADPDGSGVANYTILARASTNGTEWAWLTNTTATNATFPGVDGVRYEFRVLARDLAGNLEPAPTGADATVTFDRSPPALAIGFPEEGAVLETHYVSPVVVATDTSLSTLTCRVDGGAAGDCPGTVTLRNGAHTLEATATDHLGNAVTRQVNFTVAVPPAAPPPREPPIATILGPSVQYSTTPLIVLAAKVDARGATLAGVAFYARTSTDGERYTTWHAIGIADTAPYQLTVTPREAGWYEFQAVALDAAGTSEPVGTSREILVHVDFQPPRPVLRVEGVLEAAWYVTTPRVTLTATDDITAAPTLEIRTCEETCGDWEPYTGPLTLRESAAYRIEGRATDEAGRSQVAQVDLRVDIDSPTARLRATPTSLREGERVTVDASGSSDRSGIVSYTYAFGDGASGDGLTATHAYRKAGEYVILLTVTDATGRTGIATVTVTVTAAEPPATPKDGTPDPTQGIEIVPNPALQEGNVQAGTPVDLAVRAPANASRVTWVITENGAPVDRVPLTFEEGEWRTSYVPENAGTLAGYVEVTHADGAVERADAPAIDVEAPPEAEPGPEPEAAPKRWLPEPGLGALAALAVAAALHWAARRRA